MFGLPLIQLIGIVALAVASIVYGPDTIGCKPVESKGINWAWCSQFNDAPVPTSIVKQETIHDEEVTVPKAKEK